MMEVKSFRQFDSLLSLGEELGMRGRGKRESQFITDETGN